MATAEQLSGVAACSGATRPIPDRLKSLDVFRGLTIAAMILVNNPGSTSAVFPLLQHAAWHGCTLADLVFPCFLFIIGTSLVLSWERRIGDGTRPFAIVRHMTWRTVILIALGLILNGLFYLPWGQVRIPGILQRIGAVYFFGSLITLTTSARVRIAIVGALLLGYWGLLVLIPVPGHGAGVLTRAGNLASFVDVQLLRGHLWRENWDPEGILSTLPAIATLLLGTLTADWLRPLRKIHPAGKDAASTHKHRMVTGTIALAVLALLAGELWGWIFPINKNLWTSSFALFSGGFAALAFVICYWLVDVQGWQRWGRPFLFMGMNSLAIYVASEIAAMGLLSGVRHFVYSHWLAPTLGTHLGSVIWAITYLLVWCCVAWFMYRKQLFIKL